MIKTNQIKGELIFLISMFLLLSWDSNGQNTVERVVSPVSESSALLSRTNDYNRLADSIVKVRVDSLALKSNFSHSRPWEGKFDTIFYYNKSGLLYVTQGSPYQDSVKFRGFFIEGKLFKLEIFKLRKGIWYEDGKEYFNNTFWIGIGPRVEGLPAVHTTMKAYNLVFNQLLKDQR